MKNLTAKQLDAKFAKAAKLALELDALMNELHNGCDTFRFGSANATALENKVNWVACVLKGEREMHKANKK